MVQRKVTGPEVPPVMVSGEVALVGLLTVTPPPLPVQSPVSLVPGVFPARLAVAPGQ